MREARYFFFLVVISIFCMSCASVKNNDVSLYNYIWDDEFDFNGKRPFVNLKINDEIFTFLIDTGANYNVIYSDSIYNKAKKFVFASKEEIKKWNVFYLENENIGKIKFRIEKGSASKNCDGILGSNFLRQKSDVVTFDYKNNKIYFYQMELSGKKEKLIRVQTSDNLGFFYFMPFKIENSEEFFLLDTGADFVVLRSNFDSEKAVYPTKESVLNAFNKKKYKKTHRVGVTYLPDFSFGGCVFQKLKAVYNDNIFCETNSTAKKFLSEFSTIGYPMFKDKIFQINYNDDTVIFSE